MCVIYPRYCEANPSSPEGTVHTVNSEKIALVKFLRFLAFSLERKIKIHND